MHDRDVTAKEEAFRAHDTCIGSVEMVAYRLDVIHSVVRKIGNVCN